jgi:hypothetical protein
MDTTTDINNGIEEQAKDGYVKDDEFDKAAWAAAKKAERESVYKLLDETTEKVGSEPAALKGYLDVMAHSPKQQMLSNTLLIFAQCPHATLVGDSEYWSGKNAHIKNGEKGIKVLVEGATYTRDDGSEGKLYNVERVFDISQTTALPHLARRIDAQRAAGALVHNAPVRINPVDSADKPAYYDHKTKTITAVRGFEPVELFKALAVELAHASLAKGSNDYVREANDTRARAAAYVLAKRYGIETTGLAPDNALRTNEMDAKALRGTLRTIRNAAKEISVRADNNLAHSKEQRTAEKGGRDAR